MARDQREGGLSRGDQQYDGAQFLRRVVLGCLCVFVIPPLLLFAGWVIVDRLDSSEGTPDPVLEDRVQQYLGCIRYSPEDESIFDDSRMSASWWRVNRDLGDEGLREQVLQVSGWDQIVILAPHETGQLVADDPALTSWWLRRRIARTSPDSGAVLFSDVWSIPADARHRLLIIRDQAVVGDFTFEYAQTPIRTAVVSRWPPPGATFARWLRLVLWALALLGLVLLARRILAAFGWTRSVLGCLFGVLIVIGLLTLLLELLDWPYKVLAPLNVTQAIGGRDDPANRDLVSRLQHAVCDVPEGQSLQFSAVATDIGAVVVSGPLSLAEMRERSSRVPGWDQLVVIGPHDNARLIANEPTLETAPLRQAVREARSWPSDALKTVLVVRSGRVVGDLTLEAEQADLGSCVVERVP